MTKTRIFALAASVLLSAPAFVQASTWEIDPVHSSVEFSIRHMMVSTVKGQFEKVKGSFELDDKDITKSTVEATIDLDSVNTHEPKRDGHLKSADFFNTAKFPTATFKSTKVQKAGKGKLKVTGELSLHGTTKSVVLDVEGPTDAFKTPFGTTVRGVHATTKIDRKDFDIGWNKVLDNGGIMIGNEVTLEINAEIGEKVAAPAKPAAAPAAAPAAPAKPAK
jgi:polyisoprenoid-binding protein YceI